MRSDALTDPHWSELSRFIASAMGLHFPRERWPDLKRGLAGAAHEFGFEDVKTCADWLFSSPLTQARLQVLASHLTIGETYFFRDKQTLKALSERILPDLIRSRRGRDQRLRIWSAACCSGEEAYTLAILLHEILPDLAQWNVSIQATDINPRFLDKAAAGVYGEWSFRDAPAALKTRYFTRAGDGRYAVVPAIRKLVHFAHLNLVEDVHPSPDTNTGAMDLIFCRNVLMYFTPPQIENVIGKLHHTLVDGGWLAVSPSEASHALFSRFATVHFPGAILHQKSDAAPRADRRHSLTHHDIAAFAPPAHEAPKPWAPPTPPEQAAPVRPANDPAVGKPIPAAYAAAESRYDQGQHAEAADALIASLDGGASDPQAFSLLVRALANQGKLAEALVCCDRWVRADKVDSAGHYWRGLILLEQGDTEPARLSLRRALFLYPQFAVAHFALGTLERGRGQKVEADRHFANALRALRRHQPNDVLPESEGLAASALIETITFMNSLENAR